MMPAARSTRQRRLRSAVATVEFAIVSQILLLMVLGIIEIGRGLMVTYLLTNAARQGCRTGVIEGTATSDIKSAVDTLLASQNIIGATTTVKVNGVVADASTANA